MTNKPGRPPLDPTDRSVVVSLRLTERAFDAYCHHAAVARLSLSELLRRKLRRSASNVNETPVR